MESNRKKKGEELAAAVMAALEGKIEPGAAPAATPDVQDNEAWIGDKERQWFHRVGVKSFLAGNLYIWAACGAASRIVGRYARGATWAFARDINRSADTVENMAHAADMYWAIHRDFRGASELRGLLPKLRDVRRRLYYTHFSEMWSIWQRNPHMTPLAIFAELETAAANGISTRALSHSVRGQNGETAVVVDLRSPDSPELIDLLNLLLDDPTSAPHTYVAILQGTEWADVMQIKVRPA